MIIKRKYNLIFDLDGVLIDSKDNMHASWKKVQKIHNLYHIDFEDYFKHIGRPFFEILKILGIKKNLEKIKKTYQIESSKEKNKIKFYKNAINTLINLKNKKFVLSIVTSKDTIRTKKFLGKYYKLFKYIECDNKKTQGKPNPNKINKIIKKTKFNKSQSVYIGDTRVDYLTAKNAKIDFIYAKWGYGKNLNYKYKCEKVQNLIAFLNF